MLGVLAGFVAIWSVVAVGWVLAHTGVLAADAQKLLSRLSFFVGSPALMVTMMSTANLRRIFAVNLLVTLAATLTSALAYLLAARFLLPGRAGRTMGHTVIGTFCSSYVNAGNMGLPIAACVLHDITWIAPLLLLQIGILQPLGLAFLDVDAARRGGAATSWRQNLMMPLRNPMTLATLAGLVINLAGWHIGSLALTPLTMLGNIAVPTMLIAFGISLRTSPMPSRGPLLTETLAASSLKLFVQPLLALGFARLAGLDHATTLAVLVLAGLPTAQNIFAHAVRYDQSVELARDVVLITSLASIPTMMGIALVFG